MKQNPVTLSALAHTRKRVRTVAKRLKVEESPFCFKVTHEICGLDRAAVWEVGS